MKKQSTISIPLPAPVLASDLEAPDCTRKYKLMARESYDAPHYTECGGTVEFDLWYTERFGWCIP
ncbi:MAG: hypothetical protein KGL39_55630, partial [Patescibacteria group bacterium]|nr:hypothetical protein [Patescibacteria group bacterium]